MDLKPFKLDIDDLVQEFAEGELTTLADMKRVWMSRKFSFIFEASPTTNLACFMQSLYAHSIAYMASTTFSLSHRLGGLYCLYCLHETQPFKPPFKIYLSLGELKRLKNLVIDAKRKDIRVVSALVKSMLQRNMILFGFVDINEGSVAERVNELTDIQNARVQVAQKKLFADTRIEHFMHMDLGMELDIDSLKRVSRDYAVSKEKAITDGSKVVDVNDIKHIAESDVLIGDVVEQTANNWNLQKEDFYQRTGFAHRHANNGSQHDDNGVLHHQNDDLALQVREPNNEIEKVHEDDDDDFGMELEEILSKD